MQEKDWLSVQIFIISTLITIIFMMFIHKERIFIFDVNKIAVQIKNQFNKPAKIKEIAYDYVIDINPLEDFNGKTKEEIYKIRSYYAAKSILGTPEYEPDEKIFGNIKDGGKWLSLRAAVCVTPGMPNNEGESEESRFINNPSILIGLDRPFMDFNEKKPICINKNAKLLPTKIMYSKDKNIIAVYYKGVYDIVDFGENLFTFYFKGINARDFGYDWVYLEDGGDDLMFINPKDNVSKRVCKFSNILKSNVPCGVKGGCMGGVPHLDMFRFAPVRPTVLKFKLWKEKPKNKKEPADINYEIILE